MNPATVLFILALSPIPLLANAEEVAPGSYKIEKQNDEIKQLKGSVDSLLQALEEASRQQGSDSLSRETTAKVQKLNRQSEQLASQGKLDEARQPLQRALVMVQIAINAIKGSSPQDSDQSVEQQSEQESASEFVIEKRKQDIDKVKSTRDALMQALIRIGDEKQQQGMVRDVSSQVKEWGQRSDSLAEKGDLLQARQLLDQSLVEIKTAIGSLRDSETLIRSLNFASKQEEYDYEVDRFDTYQMLLQVMVMPKKTLTASQRKQIDQWAGDARAQRAKAGDQAKQGDFKEAVETLEGAGRTILKAIRRGGVYLPG